VHFKEFFRVSHLSNSLSAVLSFLALLFWLGFGVSLEQSCEKLFYLGGLAAVVHLMT
jgi:hypothetical protein